MEIGREGDRKGGKTTFFKDEDRILSFLLGNCGFINYN